ncbi:NIPSNAP family protein [Paenibacillus sp. NPDC058174]|uniref:NIPSNAP family protein n=1 Tax=Paenibacillus sp. NPDC058174 TaxID=3346366 RepID=UPI0036D7E5C0
MLYELRIYHINSGKMQAIQDRFKNHVIQLFGNHNMNITHFWEESDGDRLLYIVEHENMEQRNVNYDSFRNDPAWIEVRKISEINGALIHKQESIFMKDVSFFENKKSH